MKYLFLYSFLIINLFGCSSQTKRASVSDLSVYSNNISYKSGRSNSKNKGVLHGQNKYRVKRGDTLYLISWKTGLDVNSLARLNNLRSPYTIKPDQVLTLRSFSRTTKNSSKISRPFTKSTNSPHKTLYKNKDQNVKDLSSRKKIPAPIAKNKKASYSGQLKVKNRSKASFSKGKITNWKWPAKGMLIKTYSSSQAGMKGINISNKFGTAVFAAASGNVVYAGNGLRGYGNLIIIKHNNDYLSAYANNAKLLIQENDIIKVGQKIALMGNSGTDKIQLHFEIRYRGKSVNPLRYLPKH